MMLLLAMTTAGKEKDRDPRQKRDSHPCVCVVDGSPLWTDWSSKSSWDAFPLFASA